MPVLLADFSEQREKGEMRREKGTENSEQRKKKREIVSLFTVAEGHKRKTISYNAFLRVLRASVFSVL